MSDDPDNVPEGIEVIPVNISNTNPNEKSDKSEDSDSRKRFIHRIRHIDSGERPWWMDSSPDVPEGVTKLCDDSSSSEDSSESFERLDIGIDGAANFARFPLEFPPPPTDEPLGDRASPEGVRTDIFIIVTFFSLEYYLKEIVLFVGRKSTGSTGEL